ncbi:MAG: hypothetical protein SPI30_06105 [Prevotella sp.]|nr:hypothetical protein [Prevotella sp.]
MPAIDRNQSVSIIFSEECSVGGLMTDLGLWMIAVCNVKMPTVGRKQSESSPLSKECSIGGLMTDLVLSKEYYGMELIPGIGSLRTNGWYCGYQCLVRLVPNVGTMSKPYCTVSSERLIEVKSVISVNTKGHVSHDNKCLCVCRTTLS